MGSARPLADFGREGLLYGRRMRPLGAVDVGRSAGPGAFGLDGMGAVPSAIRSIGGPYAGAAPTGRWAPTCRVRRVERSAYRERSRHGRPNGFAAPTPGSGVSPVLKVA